MNETILLPEQFAQILVDDLDHPLAPRFKFLIADAIRHQAMEYAIAVEEDPVPTLTTVPLSTKDLTADDLELFAKQHEREQEALTILKKQETILKQTTSNDATTNGNGMAHQRILSVESSNLDFLADIASHSRQSPVTQSIEDKINAIEESTENITKEEDAMAVDQNGDAAIEDVEKSKDIDDSKPDIKESKPDGETDDIEAYSDVRIIIKVTHLQKKTWL